MKKEKVLKTIEFDTSIFITSFDDAITRLNQSKDKLEKQGWSDIRLHLDEGYGHTCLIVQGLRLETDGEFNKRKKAVSNRRAKRKIKEKREREYYEKLKKKFEPIK